MVGHKQRRRVGRPPVGATKGEKVKDYPQFSVRVPPLVIRYINGLSKVLAQPQWRIINQAIQEMVERLPPDDRDLVDRFANKTYEP
jgi:hypothetical protein